MKTKLFQQIVTFLLCIAMLPLTGCISQLTTDQVYTQRMDAKLEQKVLKETGLSGGFIGMIAGAAAAYLLTYAILTRTGMSHHQAHDKALLVALAGAMKGWQLGKAQGQAQGRKLINASLSRDRQAQLLQGARAYNQGLREYNAKLERDIAAARRLPEKERQAKARELYKGASRQLYHVSNLADSRRKATQQNGKTLQGAEVKWNSSQKNQYAETLPSLEARRAELERKVSELEKLQRPPV
jgi:hypothetical protein